MSTVRKSIGHVALLFVTIFLAPLLSQTTLAEPAQESSLTRQLAAATYVEGTTAKLMLHSSPHMAEAFGEAKVRRRPGITEVELDLKQMQPAMLFGGDYNTFVVWVISPEGLLENVGELILQGSDGGQNVSTSLASFAIMVTAEPHFLVSKPSPFVVLTSAEDGLAEQKKVNHTMIEYSDFAPAYKYERENLTGPSEAKGRLRTDRHQAIVAMRFAEESGAQEWATAVFEAGRNSLSATLQAFGQGLDERELTALANQTIRLAVHAKQLAEERRAAALLAGERKTNRETIERLHQEKADLQSEGARLGEQARRARELEEKTGERLKQVEQAMLTANQEADQLAREKAEALRTARSAQDQAAAFFARMQGALGQLAEIRESDRGLVVNLPGTMFASSSSQLQPRAREMISRIAGVLLVAPEYHLSIEGHSDASGNAKQNQELSEERAAEVVDYLVECGISAAMMSMRGFGESQPIVSNNTAAGRSKNRRVEIVIEGLTR